MTTTPGPTRKKDVRQVLNDIGRPLHVVVSGGRDYTDVEMVHLMLDRIHAQFGIARLAHGDARGADTHAEGWARLNGVFSVPYKADWDGLDASPGPTRNREMLDCECPDVVLAFPGRSGTRDCCLAAAERGIPVWRVGR